MTLLNISTLFKRSDEIIRRFDILNGNTEKKTSKLTNGPRSIKISQFSFQQFTDTHKMDPS